MDAAEQAEWLALDAVEPWGDTRADYRAAVICYTIAAVNYSGKGQGPKLEDFMKFFDFAPATEQTDEQIAGLFDMVAGKSQG